MESLVCAQFGRGRCLFGRLPHGKDLLRTIEEFCERDSIRMGIFFVIGAVTSATIGSYDQNQQVYITEKKDEPLEIVHCTGNISSKDGKVSVHAHGVLADQNGQTLGGHLFSETPVYAGEIFIQELTGPPLKREYDDTTGLFLWNL